LRWSLVSLGLILSLGAVAALPGADAAGNAQSIASVRFILHGLTVQPPNRQADKARVNQQLFSLYRLMTGANQKASLAFVDRSVLHMNQRTDLVLRSAQLTVVSRGEVAATVTPGTNFRIQTSNAIAAAVGTVFDVRIAAASSGSPYPGSTGGPALPAGTTTVSVVKGIVTVANGLGRVRVFPGFWTHVRPGKAPTRPTRHNAASDIQWANGLP
jgi:hypothetical protein